MDGYFTRDKAQLPASIHLRNSGWAHHEDTSIRTVWATWDYGNTFVFEAPHTKVLEKMNFNPFYCPLTYQNFAPGIPKFTDR
jgi:hypothetical protein